MSVEFAVLGPLQVRVNGREHRVGGFTRRATLGLLLLNAGRVVSISELTAALWPGGHPPTARGILLNVVSALRKAGLDIVTRKPGYLLRAEPDRVDLHRFRAALHRAASAPGPEQTAAVLRDALALWRGPVLADLVADGVTWPALVEITHLRDVAVEDRFDAELACGRHREVIAELEALVSDHPLRERLRGQLMLALYRSGRQADALAVFRAARERFAAELGIDPGPELAGLERAILTQDPALAATPGPARTMLERKKVSVLVVRLELPGADEAADERLETAVAQVLRHVEAFGGTTVTTLGSTVCAAFGAPVNREDDAARAVRAAFEITGAHPAAAAVSTGPALVTSGDRVEVGGTVLDSGLRLLAQTGKSEVRTCPVTERALTPARDDAPFVGRSREMAALVEKYEQVRATGRPRTITVVGEPGVGKSRLVREFATGRRTLTGRTPPFARDDVFAPLAEIVRSHAQIFDTDDAAAVTAKIQAISDDPWLVTQLCALAGAGPQGSDVLMAWRRLVEHLAEEPLVVVVEDVHWADELLLGFLHGLADTADDVPLLVLLTARPGPPVRGESITLDALSEEDTARLLETLMARHDVVADVRTLLRRAAGNPLFAAEYVRMLRDGAPDALPETVQTVIGARLDSLPQLERSVLQDAAVLGPAVWPGAVAVVAERDAAEIARSLEVLAQRDFLKRQPSKVFGEAEYAFSHVLVRDVAYDRVPRGTKAMKHYHAAEWVQALPLEHVPLLAYHFQEAVWIAEASGKPCDIMGRKARTALTDAGRRATALAARDTAIRCYRAALAVCPPGHPDKAGLLTLLGSCLAWNGEGLEELAEAVELHRGAQNFAGAAEASRSSWRAAWHRGDHAAAERHLDRTIEFLALAGPDERVFGVQAYLAHSLTLVDRLDDAVSAAREALRGATGVERAIALEALGLARVKQGDPDGIGDMIQAVAERRTAGVSPSLCLFNTGTAYAVLGDVDARLAVRAEARVAARRHGDDDTITWLDSSRYLDLFWDGRYAEALQHVGESIARSPGQSHLHAARGRARLLTGDLPGAAEDADRALELARSKGHPGELQHPLTLKARIALQQGEPAEVGELLTLLPGRQITGPIGVDLPIVLAAAGHGPDCLAEVSWSRWKDAALACLSGDRHEAARIYREIGSVPDADDESLVIGRK
ncbi:BTAD domain-containing putative transcriptional regulator [Lentzea flaviverrucosa]|uniref:AAA ATPase domain-containing protein n=1 Tax=Lentzea flaviverrucosa TaxID=200379 RepID=A0A1H9JU69_9PSEU|nr:BTAD domain-containing putative transcriptional regulator [Lentzea flaviverrucosa]RDI26632.1 AAA ATPase-like protein [Lentzea flaviverrucosa]SEQ90337.1 AAA ATPase domain-containing protein [Lentzea flaviverrucosa]